MTTTLPFTPTTTKKVIAAGGQLVFPDTWATKRTWFSSNGIDWASQNWITTNIPTLKYNIRVGGETWYFETSQLDDAFFDFVKTSDFLTFSYVGEFEGPGGLNNFFYNPKIVLSGGAVRHFRMAGDPLVTVYSSTDGINWTITETNLPYSAHIAKIVSFGGALYSIPYGLAAYKAIYRSNDNGFSWALLTADWGIPTATLIDCIATTEGLLAVFTNKETWTSTDGISWTKKNYTLPSGTSVLNNGVILPLGSDLFMVGCGTTQKNVFKLVEASGPVGIPL